MRCVNCGADVSDDLDVCPSCNAQLKSDGVVQGEEQRFCAVCASPLPPGVDSCPVCGLPVEGALDEEGLEQQEPVPDDSVPLVTPLVSALPPDPETVPEIGASDGDKKRHVRMLAIAGLAALLLVGGTALYITRPWDPNAYSISAKVDADTSMEGYYGEVSHLTRQDRAEEAVITQHKNEAKELMDSFHARMGEIAKEVDELHAGLSEFLKSSGDMDISDDVKHANSLRSEVDDNIEKVKKLNLEDDEDLKEQQKVVLVLADYLKGEVDIIAGCWDAAADGSDGGAAVRGAQEELALGSRGRSYVEWHELFANAYSEE